MNDWLDVMLGEIDRKKQESEESREEAERRKADKPGTSKDPGKDGESAKPDGRP